MWLSSGYSSPFLTSTFGGWILYLFFAVLAISLLGDFFPKFSLVFGLMFLLALNADRHEVESALIEWRVARPSTLFPHMFSHGNEDQLFLQLFEVVDTHPTAVLQYSGALPLMHAGLGTPVNEWFQPGITLPQEVSREKSDVAKAEFLLIPTPRWYRGDTAAFHWTDYLDPNVRYLMVFHNATGMVLAAKPAEK